jgi:hypothetical protein
MEHFFPEIRVNRASLCICRGSKHHGDFGEKSTLIGSDGGKDEYPFRSLNGRACTLTVARENTHTSGSMRSRCLISMLRSVCIFPRHPPQSIPKVEGRLRVHSGIALRYNTHPRFSHPFSRARSRDLFFGFLDPFFQRMGDNGGKALIIET